MSVQNFIPILWSKKILKELDKAHMIAVQLHSVERFQD